MATMLLLSDLAGATSPAAWREATGGRADWSVDVPPMPGRDGEPAPVGGNYDLITPGYVVARLVADRPGRRWDVVVGAGVSGWSASVTAFAGYADALVLVDGLGDPWLTAADRFRLKQERFRAIEADHAALLVHAGGGDDPRLAHGIEPHGSRDLARRAARATRVPTLIVETVGREPDEEVVAGFRHRALRTDVDPDPRSVIETIRDWWSADLHPSG